MALSREVNKVLRDFEIKFNSSPSMSMIPPSFFEIFPATGTDASSSAGPAKLRCGTIG